jgi:hypothetical protein
VQNEEGAWLCANDERVVKVEAPAVAVAVNSRETFLLFYRRRGTECAAVKEANAAASAHAEAVALSLSL